VISPKVNARTGEFIALDESTLSAASTLKFVVSATMPGYTDVPQWALTWRDRVPGRQIYVSPMNCYLRKPKRADNDEPLAMRSEVNERISFWEPGLLSLRENQANHEHAAALAMQHDVRLSLQMHLYASMP
jgi:organic radical activating enzyme